MGVTEGPESTERRWEGPQEADEQQAHLPKSELSPAEIYQKVFPGVIAIKSEQELDPHLPHMLDLRDPARSYGSGFIFDAEKRLAVTNWHVASAEDGLMLQINGDQAVAGEVVAVDPNYDLAIVRIPEEAGPLPQLELAPTVESQIGERVYTIGSPFGMDGTIGHGIVSGPSRDIQVSSGLVMVEMIQHNAITNPGNSGGVLLNSRGEVIGMNTLIMSDDGAYQGLALSVPVHQIRRAIDEFYETGKITKPSVGLHFANTEHGVVVTSVDRDSAADRAGLISEVEEIPAKKRGFFAARPAKIDFSSALFITHANGSEIFHDMQVAALLQRGQAEPVSLTFSHGAEGKSFTVELTPERVTVADVQRRHEIEEKVTDLVPPCDHMRLIGEKEPLTDREISQLLETTAFLAKVTPRGDTMDVYVHREKALKALLPEGKGFRWLEEQLAQHGFSAERGGDYRHFRIEGIRQSAVGRYATIVKAASHGAELPQIPKGYDSLIDRLLEGFGGEIRLG